MPRYSGTARHSSLAGLLVCIACASAPLYAAEALSFNWPSVTREHKPWVRWWWPGSAVDEPNLSRELQQFAAAGLGGVEVTPIYGARGYETRYVDFLSPHWVDLLAYTGREAQRLDLGVDLTTGTGWPFGGPWITRNDSLKRVVLHDGALTGQPTGMHVKRAAPGDEGLVLDPYSPVTMQHYLARFSTAFAHFPTGLLRAQFHDSFEYYDASWTPEFAAAFRQQHGYDLQPFAAEFIGEKPLDPDRLGRIKSDYRETLSQLHASYLAEWIRWSHAHGWLVRNQSHGAPANLLDLYGAVDIPETEVFGSTPFPIPGLRRDPADIRSDQDAPDPLVLRLASSAAHVMGRPLASSETCTWLREHWKTSLAFAKPEIDQLFTCGINHIIYHGSCYSPQDAPWPGWLFYASTEFQPTNPWWDDFAALNAYVTRVQSILQSGHPDNDILLYWPFDDLLDSPNGLMRQFVMDDVSWLRDSSAGRLARQLTKNGYAFDFISDAQLADTRTTPTGLVTPGGNTYRAIVVPATRRMPVPTLAHLLALARAGVPVIFEKLPEDVPGYGRFAERRDEFTRLLREISPSSIDSDVLAELAHRNIRHELTGFAGLSYVRRTNDLGGHDYFFANLTARSFDGWLPLDPPTQTIVLCDPLTGRIGPATQHLGSIYFQLAPGASIIVRTSSSKIEYDAPPWRFGSPLMPVQLGGVWHIQFIKGGPDLPPHADVESLQSWTEFSPAAQRFAGTARYTLEFSLSQIAANDWLLDLGDVRESARVKLNGIAVATLWSVPFRARVGQYLHPGANVLQLEVTNLAANRIRDLDQRHVSWKIMREINFVDIHYHPFDASHWPLTPSGLLGPVTLIPLKFQDP